MKSVDASNRALLATGQVLSLAGTILLAGPAFAGQNDGGWGSFKEFRQERPGVDKQELRQLLRADRQERNQLRQNIREQTGGGQAFRAEYHAIKQNQNITQPSFNLPTVSNVDKRSTYVNDRGKTKSVTRAWHST